MALSGLERDLVGNLSATTVFAHIEKLCGFGPRPLGSSGDENSIQYLEEHFRSYGAEFETVDFEIAVARKTEAQLRLVSPQERSIDCQANYRSAPSAPQGITTSNVMDVGYGTDEGYEGRNTLGAIVLAMEGRMHPVAKSELAARMGAAGCVWITDRRGGMISTWGLARYGSTIPVVSISYEDGEFLRRLLSEDRITLSMRIDTDLKKSKGTHVIGVARGEKWPQEVSVLCAHRESVPSSPGANDNASGVAVVLEVMKALTSYRPKRTIWALLSTGEEGGGIGIRAFVAENKAKMESVRAAIDVDVVGQGANLCVFTEGRWPDRTVTTSDGPNNVLVEAASDLGYCLVRSASPMGLGDTEGFIEAGIPGAWLGREMKEMGHIHTAKDLPETIDINSLKVAADILLIALLRLDQRVTLDDL